MAAPLRLVDAAVEPILPGTSRDFEEGTVTEIVAGSAAGCVRLLEAFLGFRAPDGGKVILLGEDVGTLSRNRLYELRSRVGVYPRGGGLISNLKAVENVALPLLYHSGEGTDGIAEKAFRALDRAGYDGSPFELPGRLSVFQRATVGLARVLAADPEVVFFDRLGSELPEAERRALLDPALDFHRERPGRATVFLFPHPGTIPGDAPRTVLNLSKGRFE
jgi:ABC-type transporter Mla maintaining outer membrane lipid asymmetry ATPase subunit MlaF